MDVKTTFSERLKVLYSQTTGQVAVRLQFSGREDLPLTYEQLLRGASAYSRTLAREGIQPGEVTVLILQHGEDLVYSFWGAILQGAIPSIMPFLTEKLSPEQRAIHDRMVALRGHMRGPFAVWLRNAELCQNTANLQER